MAEATIMLMLVSLYDLKSAENQLREMRPRPRGPMSARMVKGKTIGIIGYGNISRAIIRRLTGWDARIVVSTRAPGESRQGVAFVGLDQLLEESRAEEPTPELQSLMRSSYAVYRMQEKATDTHHVTN